MFDVEFDDFKRKLAAKPNFPYMAEKIETCYRDTPDYDIWMPAYMSDTNTDIHLTVSQDNKLFTFYKLIKKEPVK
jgi:hypothetical protein